MKCWLRRILSSHCFYILCSHFFWLNSWLKKNGYPPCHVRWLQKLVKSHFGIQTRSQRHSEGLRPRRLEKTLQPSSQCPTGVYQPHRVPHSVADTTSYFFCVLSNLSNILICRYQWLVMCQKDRYERSWAGGYERSWAGGFSGTVHVIWHGCLDQNVLQTLDWTDVTIPQVRAPTLFCFVIRA